MRPLAIIPAYNEADILPGVIRHLRLQGCAVHVIDNWSTDGTADVAMQAGADSIERWPAQEPSFYDWTGILKRIEEVAFANQGRWILFHDADEIRRPPARFGDLSIAMTMIGWSGANAIDFEVETYVPVDNNFPAGSNPEQYFHYRAMDHVDHHIPHIKAWLQRDVRVDLHSSGGHQAEFPGRVVNPYRFTLKHYPIRSQQHGERKVLTERFPRYSAEEREKGWHVQYDAAKTAGSNYLADPAALRDTRRRDVTVVTLTRFPDIFGRFAESVELHEPTRRRIVVTSGGCKIDRPGWMVIEGVEPFVFARNLNLGLAAAGDQDVLAVNDDVLLTEPIIEEMLTGFESPGFGIVTPRVEGNGINLIPAWASEPRPAERFVRALSYIPFVCVLLSRAMLRDTGLLEESFTGYGGDDEEFNARARHFGWSGAISSQATVTHGFGDRHYSSSFLRIMTPEERERSMAPMRERADRLTAAGFRRETR